MQAFVPSTRGSLTDAAEMLAIPFVLTIEARPGIDGSWVCRAAHPELGLSVDDERVTEAVRLLGECRVRHLLEQLRRGRDVVAPRSPLPHLVSLYGRQLSAALTDGGIHPKEALHVDD